MRGDINWPSGPSVPTERGDGPLESGGGGAGEWEADTRPRVWTSIQEGETIPPAWGTLRLPSVFLYQGATRPGFPATASKDRLRNSLNQDDGEHKGLGTPAVIGVAIGPIAAFVRFFLGKEMSNTADAGQLGRLGFGYRDNDGVWIPTSTTTSHLGTGLAAFARPTALDPDPQGQAWEGVAQVRSDGLGLTDDGELPELAWEIRAFGVAATGETDADPADVVLDLCTSAAYGLGLSTSQVQVDVGPDGLASSSFRRWCQANNFRVSGHAGGRTVKAALDEIAESCFAKVVYSEGKIKLVPMGAETLTGFGYTYTPAAPFLVDASDWKDLVIDQVPDEDVYNTWVVRFDDRESNGQYESRVVQYQDEAHAAASGVRRSNEVSTRWLKTRDRAFRLAQYRCKESIYQRAMARFTLPRHYGLLEPGDTTQLDVFGVTRTFRITAFDRLGGGRIGVEASEVPAGASTPIDLTPATAALSQVVRWSTAAQAASGLEGIGGGNLVRNSSFDDGVGTPHGWGTYDNAGVGAVASKGASGGVDGGAYLTAYWVAGSPSQLGVYTRGNPGSETVGGKTAGVAWQAGRWYTVSFWASATWAGIPTLQWNSPGPSQQIAVACPALTGSWQRYVFRVFWNGGLSPQPQLYIDLNSTFNAPTSGTYNVDQVQVEEGNAPTAYAPRTDETLPGTITTPEIGDEAVVWQNVGDGQANTANLFPNPTSEVAPPANAPASVLASPEFANRYNAGAGAYAGDWVRRLTAAASSYAALGPTVPVSPGEIVSIEAQAKWISGAAAVGYVYVRAFDKGGAQVGQSVSGYASTGSWVRLAASLTVPASAVTVLCACEVAGGASGGTVDFDAIVARKADAGGYDLEKAARGAISAIARSSSDPTTARVFYRGGDRPDFQGGGTPRLMDPAWVRSTAYVVGDVVVGDPTTGGTYPITNYGGGGTASRATRAYRCTQAGTSASSGTGPTGTGTAITDGGCKWDYVTTIANRERLSIQCIAGAQIGTTAWRYYAFKVTIQPKDFTTDNLDGMRYLKVEGIHQSDSLTKWTRYLPITDRCYVDTSTDGTATNAVVATFDLMWDATTVLFGDPFAAANWIRITPVNAYGSGQARDYAGTGSLNADFNPGVLISGNTPADPAGGGGGDEGGGYCPSPETLITLDSGRRIPAGELRPGHRVWAQPEHGGAFGSYDVQAVELLEQSERVAVVLDDGRRIVCSPGHRFLVGGGRGFTPAASLEAGAALLGLEPGTVRHLEAESPGPVVRITVKDAHTYVNDGLTVHNAKPRT